MKEQIHFSNGTMKLNNTSEVAVRTPRMVDGELTTKLFRPKLDVEGGIFMAEPGQGEGVPGGNTPKTPEAPKPKGQTHSAHERVKNTRKLWESHYLKGRELSSLPHDERETIEAAIKAGVSPISEEKSASHTSEEKEKIRATGEELMRLAGTPEFKKQTKELAEKTPEQEKVKEKREESKGIVAYGQLRGEGERRDPILERRVEEEIQGIQEEYRQQEGREIQIGEIEREGIRRSILSQDRLNNHMATINLAGERLDTETAINSLSQAVRSGEIQADHAQSVLDQLYQRAAAEMRARRAELTEEQIRQRAPERLESQELATKVEATDPDSPERAVVIKEFSEWLDSLDPDSPLDSVTLGYIAKYEEVAEKFLDKIISKPLSTPTDHYELSFYAGINLQTFLSEVRAVRPGGQDRFEKYSRLRATTLIFHEMNRGITVESGNIGAFLSLTRSVNPYNLQIATELDGVEKVRQLYDQAFGRLYTERSEASGTKVDDDIYDWVRTQSYKQAGYERDENGQWTHRGRPARELRPETSQVAEGLSEGAGDVLHPAPARVEELVPPPTAQEEPAPPPGPVPEVLEVIRSRYGRPLDPWEIERALAFGRNIHASFYRKSELYSWSNVPLPFQKWINAPPTETVIRALAGLKWLTYRFRFGEVGGGPTFTQFLYRELTKRYTHPKKEADKLNLKKLGKLDILKDIIPVGAFSGAGFDSGWRIQEAYHNSDVMKVRIDNKTYSNSPDHAQTAIYHYLQAIGFSEEDIKKGVDVDLGDFMIQQEYNARQRVAKGSTYAWVRKPPMAKEMEEFLPSDFGEIQKQMREVLAPLMGVRLDKKLEKGYEIDPKKMDQINLSLGTLIKYHGSDTTLKSILWEKTADLLPLRTAYMLSEDGVNNRWVKNLEGYEAVKGEGNSLFSDDFESKLIKAQSLRIEKQKENARNGDRTTVKLDSFLSLTGMAGPEIELVKQLQALGKDNAKEFAKIGFPHIPFLEDVPFGEAKYTELPLEVFPRRMGSDFEGFYNATAALNNIVGELQQPYPQILQQMKAIKDGVSASEGPLFAQNAVVPILKTYMKMAEQWVWTRYVPFAKTIRQAVGMPTSWLQAFHGRDALSTDESTMNRMANEAVNAAVIRREKLPGEEKSQFDDVTEHVGAKWHNVALDQGRTASVIIALILMGSFFAITGKGITEELRR